MKVLVFLFRANGLVLSLLELGVVEWRRMLIFCLHMLLHHHFSSAKLTSSVAP